MAAATGNFLIITCGRRINMMCFIGSGFSSRASVSSKEILRDCHCDDNSLLLLANAVDLAVL